MTHKKLNLRNLTAGAICLASITIFAGCGSDDDSGNNNKMPSCTISNPEAGQVFISSDNISVAVIAEDDDGTIAEVKLYVDSVSYGVLITSPYNFVINAGILSLGKHTLKAVAKDNQGGIGEASVTISVEKLVIGLNYLGGIVAYIDETEKHGFIAAPSDQNTGIRWNNGSYITTGATGTAVGTGQSNTILIVQACGDGSYAAKLCDDLELNGYSDWFLPSIGELNILFQNRDLIGGFSTSGSSTSYWSSSEYSNSYAWYQNFINGAMSNALENYNYRVRAVRAF
ncbi:MAG: DUF1566 domain-containing protein [Paludibacter sp.]|nr:DUF1566 domain-containing protein [Paludibacter sp.]